MPRTRAVIEPRPKKGGYRGVPKGHYATSADSEYVSLKRELHDHIAWVFRTAIASRDLTHADVGAHMGLSISAVRDRLSGKTDWSAEEAAALARWLSIPLSVLFSLDATVREIRSLNCRLISTTCTVLPTERNVSQTHKGGKRESSYAV